MVQLQEFRDYMKKLAEEDRKRRTVQVSAATIDEALEQAAIELGVSIKHLEYELLQKPSAGFMGYGKKECVLIAYEIQKKKKNKSDVDDFEIDLDSLYKKDHILKDRDGEAIIKFRQEGVFLKVTPPIGKGKRVTEKQAELAIKKRGISSYDKSIVSVVVKKADDELIRIADYNYDPTADHVITVEIDDLEMTAKIVLTEPGKGGTDIVRDDIISFLTSNGVIHGIAEKEIQELADHPVYNKSIIVAKGTKPINGKNARIVYNFDTEGSHIDLKEKQGKIDFREMNKIQNVVTGQVLAKKIPLKEGKPGSTITGKVLAAKDGKDVKFNLGKNVELSKDGLVVRSEINGQVMLSKGKLTVTPVYVVEGDVNLKTGGNVIFLGSVIVKGSVDEGYKVKASGNVEILGNVGKAEIDAEGDIIVHQGINGKIEGQVRAGKRIFSKFIENVNIEGNEAVIATDGIMNSNVLTKGIVACVGKRGTIVGGRVRATEEIHAKIIGSASGSETILEVGWDPQSKERLENLEKELEEATGQYDDVERNLLTLNNLKKKKKELSKDKALYLNELEEQKINLKEKMIEIKDGIEEENEYLSSLKNIGKISASIRVMPGVKINIKEAFLKVRSEYGKVTFKNEGGEVKVVNYEPLTEDLTILK